MAVKQALITGRGVLAATGMGVEEVWQAVLAGRTRVTEVDYAPGGQPWVSYPCHAIGPLPVREWVTADGLAFLAEHGMAADRDFSYLLAASRLALADSGLTYDRHDNRVGLVIAHENPGVVALVDRLLEVWCADPGPDRRLTGANPADLFRHFGGPFFRLQTFPHLFFLARILGLHGPTLIVNNSCASGLYALEAARQMIAAGQADAVLVVAADHAHATEYLWLRGEGFASPSGLIRPFDRRRDGAVLGDGAAAVVLESPAAARRRGAAPLAVYRGGLPGAGHLAHRPARRDGRLLPACDPRGAGRGRGAGRRRGTGGSARHRQPAARPV